MTDNGIAGLLSTGETVERPTRSVTRVSRWTEDDLRSARSILAKTYETQTAMTFTFDEKDAKAVSSLLRHVADLDGGGVSIRYNEETRKLTVFGKDRKQHNVSDDPKPRKPRETKGRAGTADYQRAYAQYLADLEAWQIRQATTE